MVEHTPDGNGLVQRPRFWSLHSKRSHEIAGACVKQDDLVLRPVSRDGDDISPCVHPKEVLVLEPAHVPSLTSTSFRNLPDPISSGSEFL